MFVIMVVVMIVVVTASTWLIFRVYMLCYVNLHNDKLITVLFPFYTGIGLDEVAASIKSHITSF
jgi:hypothetical protein